MSQTTNTTACIVYNNKAHPILEMWEGFTGWYWFITERYPDTNDVAFGYVVGFEKEWGDIDLAELRKEYKIYACWPVPQENWFSNSHVTMVDTDKLNNGV